MPIWLRRFTFHQIQSYYKKESQSIEKEQQQSKGKSTAVTSDGKVNPSVFPKLTKSSYK